MWKVCCLSTFFWIILWQVAGVSCIYIILIIIIIIIIIVVITFMLYIASTTDGLMFDQLTTKKWNGILLS